MADWYKGYITHRNLTTEIGGHKETVTVGVGFPQGGVCSAKFWIIAFDKAIQIINQGDVIGQGFADDLCVLSSGKNLNHITQNAQTILTELQTWANSCNLEFSPEKTVAMFFNKKRKITKKLYINPVSYTHLTLPTIYSV